MTDRHRNGHHNTLHLYQRRCDNNTPFATTITSEVSTLPEIEGFWTPIIHSASTQLQYCMGNALPISPSVQLTSTTVLSNLLTATNMSNMSSNNFTGDLA